MKHNTEAVELVNFDSQQSQILELVSATGDVEKIDTWKEAFPTIKFPRKISGNKVDWSQYSKVELAAFIAIMSDPTMAMLVYTIAMEDPIGSMTFDKEAESTVEGVIDELDILLHCWLLHIFDYFNDSYGEIFTVEGEKFLYKDAKKKKIGKAIGKQQSKNGAVQLGLASFRHSRVI